MKKQLLLTTALLLSAILSYSQDFTLVTTIESVVPGGLGRSRMITTTSDGKLQEIPMENFFSLVGINFENIRMNDQTITDKIVSMSKDGWVLINTIPGVYGSGNKTGIFITRYLFKKEAAK
jgi:hypothetical protein